MNNKILLALIAVAFVGGLFSAAYAGPILPTITLGGDTHTLGDADIDGTLNVDGTLTAPDITSLNDRVAALESLTASMTVSGNDVFFTGVNVRIMDGTGTTACAEGICNGLGNLIVGYDEPRLSGSDKTGSHNLVIGPNHNYPSYGGAVAGFENTVSGASSSVSGGQGNKASGDQSSVSGGGGNTASSVQSSVSGGLSNEASGLRSSVSGGNTNIASGVESSVSGGFLNEAIGDRSSVSGGRFNDASGLLSSVSGGQSRTASGQFDWKAGGLFETIDFVIPDFIKQPFYAFFNL